MSLEDDVRVAHADPAKLGKKDLARRRRVVKLLRTLPHELDREDRRRAARIRASFTNAGDYVNLLGTRREHAWVVGEIEDHEGRRVLVTSGANQARYEIAAAAISQLDDTDGLWFGRAATD